MIVQESLALQDTAHNHSLLPAQAERASFMQTLHESTVTIDTNTEIYPIENIGMYASSSKHGYSVVAEVALPKDSSWGNHFAVVKSPAVGGGKEQYCLYGLTVDSSTGKARVNRATPVVVPSDGSTLWIGRGTDSLKSNALWDDEYDSQVSKKHVGLGFVNGQLVLTDSSLNGTKYAAGLVGGSTTELDSSPKPSDYVDEHTVSAQVLAQRRGLIDHEGKFSGRHTITRDSEIGGNSPYTVDIRSWQAGGEAIVVDAHNQDAHWYRHYLDSALYQIKAQEQRTGRKADEQTVLQAIYQTVDKNMQYDLAFVDGQSQKIEGSKIRKVNLSYYIAEGKGVCRHMALACAWLGGELKQKGYLAGKLTAEVNQHATNGAHEWARYTAPSGEVTILDVAQHHIGDVVSKNWDYRRREEKEAAVEQMTDNQIKPKKRGFGRLFRDIIKEMEN